MGLFSRKKLLALLLVVILPLGSYFFISQYADSAVQMPAKYLYDTVIFNHETGRYDTSWHQIKDIKLINQFGDSVSLYQLRGKTMVFDFFFTRCPSICPALTKNMYRLQESIVWKEKRSSLRKRQAPVHLISISIDPERDSPSKLLAYANKYNANHDVWWFLTGDKSKIYDYVIDELKLGLVDGNGVDEHFIHSDRFVLVDKNFTIRGYYKGLDSTDIKNLANDIGLLILEKR